MTFILRPCARSATMLPTRPMPMMPRVLLKISFPMNLFFSHFPFFMEAVAWGILRASDNIMEMACSPVVMVLPPGVFMTTIPRLLAARMSTLSRPTPARPMTLRFSALSMMAWVTLVALRITRPSYSLMTPLNSSGVRLVITSTSISGVCFSTLIPSAERVSLTNTLFMKHISFVDFIVPRFFADSSFPVRPAPCGYCQARSWDRTRTGTPGGRPYRN